MKDIGFTLCFLCKGLAAAVVRLFSAGVPEAING